jgi:competence protein ComFB
MIIHNMMEDIVIEMVKNIFYDEKKISEKSFCTCSQCELDVICFVLNNIPPKYVISGRGLARLESNYLEQKQKEADLVSLIHMGIKNVSNAKRPHFLHEKEESQNEVSANAYFNIPTITGRVFNTTKFEPAKNVTVSLLHNGEPLKMLNPNWQNPQKLVPNTQGAFSFWPHPIEAEKKGIKKSFDFEIIIDEDNYEKLIHYINLSVISESEYVDYYRINKNIKVDDLYLLLK